MWELDYKESWVLKNWCFWTVLLETTLESPFNCKEFQPVDSKGNQSWLFFGRTGVETETPILWPPNAKNWFIAKDPDAGKDWRREEKGTIKHEIVGWHHRLNGQEFEQTLGVGAGQGGVVCCSLCAHKESSMTEWLNWTWICFSKRREASKSVFLIKRKWKKLTIAVNIKFRNDEYQSKNKQKY